MTEALLTLQPAMAEAEPRPSTSLRTIPMDIMDAEFPLTLDWHNGSAVQEIWLLTQWVLLLMLIALGGIIFALLVSSAAHGIL